MCSAVFLASLLALLPLNECYKMAIFAPDMSGSQILFSARVANTLAEAGHNVTLIRLRTLPYKDVTVTIHPNVEEWLIDAVDPEMDYESLQKDQASIAFKKTNVFEMFSSKMREQMGRFTSMMTKGCELTVKNKEFLAKLKAANFELAFAHMYEYCPIGLIHYAGIPTWIWLNSATLADYVARDIGVPMPPSYVPLLLSDASDVMTFWQRTKTFLGYYAFPYFHHHVLAPRGTEIFREHVDPNFPSLREISKGVPLVMVNSNELYDIAHPTLHKVINIGGLGMAQKDAKPLTGAFAEAVEKAENVIVFTFGSVANATNMPWEWKVAFMAAFKRFPTTTIFFRYSASDIDEIKPDNVITSKWLPQADLLQHPKTRALITHGGYNSMQEAIAAGTPIITIPLFGDQFRNGRIAAGHGFGYYVEKDDVSEESIVKAISTILNDNSYSATVKKLQRMVFAKPQQAEEMLVQWTEFLAEFKQLPNLVPNGTQLTFIQYHCLDVVAVLTTAIFVVLWITFVSVRFVIRRIVRALRSVLGFTKKQKTN